MWSKEEKSDPQDVIKGQVEREEHRTTAQSLQGPWSMAVPLAVTEKVAKVLMCVGRKT